MHIPVHQLQHAVNVPAIKSGIGLLNDLLIISHCKD